MANFNTAVEKILDIEGGYQNRRSDEGNLYKGQWLGTNKGITPATLARYLGRDVTVSDMKNLSTDLAKSIYQERYWNKIHGDLIDSQEVATIYFDAAVNQGRGTAVKMMQQVLNNNGANIKVDTLSGPNTITQINNMIPERLHNQYRDRRLERYYEVNQSDNINGWIKRLEDFPYLLEHAVVDTPSSSTIVSNVSNTASVVVKDASAGIHTFLRKYTYLGKRPSINRVKTIENGLYIFGSFLLLILIFYILIIPKPYETVLKRN